VNDDYYSNEPKDFTPLPEELDSKIAPLWECFQEARDTGDMEQAEKFALAAWNELPEPKLSWDFYANVIPYDLVEFYRHLKRFKEAASWLELARESYGPGRDISIEFLAASLKFEQGDLDGAFTEFNRQFKMFGKRAFRGEPAKYLAFTLKRRKE
jgi:tetratricopeptide (TPR) repeat protein